MARILAAHDWGSDCIHFYIFHICLIIKNPVFIEFPSKKLWVIIKLKPILSIYSYRFFWTFWRKTDWQAKLVISAHQTMLHVNVVCWSHNKTTLFKYNPDYNLKIHILNIIIHPWFKLDGNVRHLIITPPV